MPHHLAVTVAAQRVCLLRWVWVTAALLLHLLPGPPAHTKVKMVRKNDHARAIS